MGISIQKEKNIIKLLLCDYELVMLLGRVFFLFIFEMRSCSMMDMMGMMSKRRMNGRVVNTMVKSMNNY